MAVIGGRRDLLPSDDVSLVDEGILDSFGLAEVVALVERAYGVKVPDAAESGDPIRAPVAFLAAA